MSSTIIYKQSYKSRTAANVAGLNVRHLQYIATRPGTVYNQGCGFGLWGQGPGDGGIRIQTDLEQAKYTVRAASADHTLYRAVVSVGRQDAEDHGLYDRARWERLINDHIQAIAREMDIKPENFCWYASMHYKKNHPHVHLVFWDNGDQPKPEAMPKQRFAVKVEHIRAEFAGDIHRQEIRGLQQQQRAQIAPLRAAVLALCREANPEKPLNLTALEQDEALEDLVDQMETLLRELPARGSLRYGYLPLAYKAKVDAMVRACLKVPDIQRQLAQYEACTRQISDLYGNGRAGADAAWWKAEAQLCRSLGNEVMAAVRELQEELRQDALDGMDWGNLARQCVRNPGPTQDAYRKLLALLPRERIPLGCMERQIPGYFAQMNQVMNAVLEDGRLRTKLQGYALDAAGIDLGMKPDAPSKTKSGQAAPGHRNLFGKEVTDAEWNAYQDAYRQARKELRAAMTRQAREDAGWAAEAVRTGTSGLLRRVMLLVSQAAGQRKAAARQAKAQGKGKSKDQSREAKKDWQATQALAGDEEYE